MKKLLLTLSIVFMGVTSYAQWGGGGIDARRRSCSADLCRYDLNWRVNGQNSVVVLEVQGGPESGVVKLLGCSGSNGYSDIPWIRRDGAQYIFHLFNSNRCTKDVHYYERPVASTVIQEGSGGGWNGGGGNDGGYGDLNARRLNCSSDMCTYEIGWKVRGNASVVTVVDNQTGREKLFACASSYGNQEAPWIPRNGMRVEFRLYDSNRCTADVGKYERPVDTVTVSE